MCGKGEKCAWSSRSPKDIYLRPTLSIDMTKWLPQWDRQKRCCVRRKEKRKKKQGPMAENYCCNKKCDFFMGEKDEDKRRQRMVNFDLFVFQNWPF